MPTYLFLIALIVSPSVKAFSIFNSTGLDMQSVSLMRDCQINAEKAAITFVTVHNSKHCTSQDTTVPENSTKLTGLALDRKGFVYDIYVESECTNTVKLEITVGPSPDGKNCFLLRNPVVLGTVSTQ